MNADEAKAEVLRAGNELVERGLVARTWGNASCRISGELCAITPSGIAYDRLTLDDISVVNINTLEYEGRRKPSSEKGIHAAAYRLMPQVNFVIHTHQAFASAMSITGFLGSALTGKEKDLLGGGIDFSAYGLPGTKTLSRNVERALRRNNGAILMERHGALLTGTDRQSAFGRAVLLEELCRCSLPVATDCEKKTYSERTQDNFTLTHNSASSSFQLNSAFKVQDNAIALLHAAIYTAYPDIRHIAHIGSAPVLGAMEKQEIMPAMLDDFAQMVGVDAKIDRTPCEKITQAAAQGIAKKLRNRNCLCVEGMGALCCAGDESDCSALMMIVEKNALACVHAAKTGKAAPLSFIDRQLMRFVYTHKYAKKAKG